MKNTDNKYIYEKIVNGDDDISGMIAYCYYKKDKIRFISEHKATKNGEEPTKDELLKFQESKIQSIDDYRHSAENIYTDLINTLLKTERDNIAEKLRKYETKKRELDEREKNINKRDKNCKVESKGFWYGVWQSIVANLIYIVISIILVLYIKYGDVLGITIGKINK